MYSAAATLGLTISQFAITRVLGTVPSVCQPKTIRDKQEEPHKVVGYRACKCMFVRLI